MPREQISAALIQTVQLVAGGTIRIPDGLPMKLEQFADAVRSGEAPAHGGKPLFVLGD